jgi:hypothetical protein
MSSKIMSNLSTASVGKHYTLNGVYVGMLKRSYVTTSRIGIRYTVYDFEKKLVNDEGRESYCVAECEQREVHVFYAVIGKYYRAVSDGRYLGKYLGEGQGHWRGGETGLSSTYSVVYNFEKAVLQDVYRGNFLVECNEGG